MKRLRYILITMMSLLVIYAGAGVSIIHYCCNNCETVQACCTNGCSKCQKAHHQSDKSCKDEGCTATFHKVDLVKQAVESSFVTPIMPLICELLPIFQSVEPSIGVKEIPWTTPPRPDSSRIYLALYSVLLI